MTNGVRDRCATVTQFGNAFYNSGIIAKPFLKINTVGNSFWKAQKVLFRHGLQGRHGSDLGQFLSDFAHILIDRHLVGRIAEGISGMVCGHDVIAVLLDEDSPHVMHDGLCTEESLVSSRAAQKDHLRPYQHKLLGKKRLAGMYLFRSRTPVLGRTALGDIADMVVVARKAVASQEILQELA